MKRKAFLTIAGCTVKRFDNMQLRDQLPFRPQFGAFGEDAKAEYAQADYSVMDAFRMRVFLDAAENKGLSVEAAKYIAGNCERALRGASAVGGDGDLWIFYAQGRAFQPEDGGDAITGRTLGAGTLDTLAEFVAAKVDRDETQFLALINASLASRHVLGSAVKAGLINVAIEDVWMGDYRTTGAEG